jgi:hypothetical protein
VIGDYGSGQPPELAVANMVKSWTDVTDIITVCAFAAPSVTLPGALH